MEFGNLNIEWKGHSGIFISGEKNIYIDPYKIGDDEEMADIVLITHSHYDHCSVEDLEKIIESGTVVICPPDCQSKLTKINSKIDLRNMTPGQDIEIEDIDVKAFPAYNPEKSFHEEGEGWNGYIIRIGDKVLYHAGDTGVIPEMSDLGESVEIDIAFLPVDGKYTMNSEEASRAVVLIRPKLSIPIHYGEVAGSEEDAKEFVKLCKEEDFEAEILEKK